MLLLGQPVRQHGRDAPAARPCRAGVLAASYAAGTLLAALPAAALAARIGPRRAVIGGLLVLGAATAVFGFARHIVLLDVARFVQGAASALTWAAALTWIVSSAPPGRRGQMIGTALAAAVAGALLGPAIGGLASAVGPERVFGSMLAVTAVLAAVAVRLPEAGRAAPQPLREVLARLASARIGRAVGFVALPSVMFGAVAVLVPLRIDELGGGEGIIVAGFVGAAAIEGVLAPLAGRASDRRGRYAPTSAGLMVCAAAILLVPAGQTVPVVVAALVGSSVGAGICFAPATAALSDSADAAGLHQAYAAGLLNVAWALGQMTGSGAGGGVAEATSDAVPCVLLAVALAASAAAAWRMRGRMPAGVGSGA